MKCRACPQMMRVAEMPSGALNPLDTGEIPLDVVLAGAKGVVAYSPKTGRGRSITKKLLAENPLNVVEWSMKGATFHVSHFATCPERKRFKRS